MLSQLQVAALADLRANWRRCETSRRLSSACLRRVISRETPKVPMMLPWASRRGIFVVETQATWGSGQVSFSSLPKIGCPVLVIWGKEEKETWPDRHVPWVSTTKMPLLDAH